MLGRYLYEMADTVIDAEKRVSITASATLPKGLTQWETVPIMRSRLNYPGATLHFYVHAESDRAARWTPILTAHTGHL